MNSKVWNESKIASAVLLFAGICLVFCSACAYYTLRDDMELSQADEKILKSIRLIKLETNSTTWRDETALDISQIVKEHIEGAGFRVVLTEDEAYDAVLKIDYQEIKGDRCYVEDRAYIPGYETIISFSAQLEHEQLGSIFNRKIYAESHPRITTTQKLLSPSECEEVIYKNMVDKLIKDPSFKYLGELIALRLGTFVDQLKDENAARRSWGAQLMGEIKYVQGVEALIVVLEDKNPSVRQEAAIALGKIGDARAIEPLQALSATEKNKTTKSVLEQALKQLRKRQTQAQTQNPAS